MQELPGGWARLAVASAVGFVAGGTAVWAAASDDGLRLDGTGAFFYPEAVQEPDAVLVEGRAADDGIAPPTEAPVDPIHIEVGTWLRYLAARQGFEDLEELAFDLALARACRERGLARSAHRLAPGIATQRLVTSGRRVDQALRRRFVNEALREQRIEALVVADRPVTQGELEALFERQYGPGGVREIARQIVVTFVETRRRLEARPGAGEVDDDAVEAAARARAEALRARIEAGTPFGELLRESDDRRTLEHLKDPDRRAGAGVVEPRRARRYGTAFRELVARLDEGEVGGPVRSSRGYHVVEMTERKVTRFEDVEEWLRRSLKSGDPTDLEVRQLRRALLEKYGLDRALREHNGGR